jgi:FkbM family methyltransferase
MGIIRPIVRTSRKLAHKGYEAGFHTACLQAVRSGDVVWDIGANDGFYTIQFAQKVGSSGSVIAFEPSPRTAQALREAVSAFENVVVEEVALSDFNGRAKFFASAEATTDGLMEKGEDTEHTLEVFVRRGDDYARIRPPSVVKIDVEGFEKEVLVGLGSALEGNSLHSVLVEVHFQELNRRGLVEAPRQIVDLLTRSGFTVAWTDPSHIISTKRKI